MSDATATQSRAASGEDAARPTVARDDFLFHLLVVLTRYRDAKLDGVLTPLGLNVSRHRAVSVIANFEPCTMSELAEFSCVDRTTMTRTVDQLVAAGLVHRRTPPEDRRQVLLTLTELGHAIHVQALDVVAVANKEVLDGVSDDLRRSFMRAERAMVANLIGDEMARDRIVSFRRPESPAKA